LSRDAPDVVGRKENGAGSLRLLNENYVVLGEVVTKGDVFKTGLKTAGIP
jgi:hypothetical protein